MCCTVNICRYYRYCIDMLIFFTKGILALHVKIINVVQLVHLFLPFVMWSCNTSLLYLFRTFSRVITCIWHKMCIAYQVFLCLLCCLIIAAHFQNHSQKSVILVCSAGTSCRGGGALVSR